MPPASMISQWPKEDREELNRLLVEHGYGNLKTITELFAQKGYEISIATVGRHSKGLKETIAKAMERAQVRLQTARALGGMSASEKADMLETGEMVLFDKLMETLEEWDSIEKKDRPKAIAGLMRASSDFGGSARNTSKWKAENEARIRQEAMEQAASIAAETAKQAGVTPQTIAKIRQALGMSDG